jgi:hypothetical protein
MERTDTPIRVLQNRPACWRFRPSTMLRDYFLTFRKTALLSSGSSRQTRMSRLLEHEHKGNMTLRNVGKHSHWPADTAHIAQKARVCRTGVVTPDVFILSQGCPEKANGLPVCVTYGMNTTQISLTVAYKCVTSVYLEHFVTCLCDDNVTRQCAVDARSHEVCSGRIRAILPL